MRSVFIVGLLVLSGCEGMRSTLASGAPAQTERKIALCRSHALSDCRSLSVAEYQRLLRSLNRPSTGPGIVH